MSTAVPPLVTTLARVIDEYAPVFARLSRGSRNLEEYLSAQHDRRDEEILTEPILRTIIERVLGFPRGAYLEQLGKEGRKPDFTPSDLIAHPFVLDAKSTDENLAHHEAQIRGYMDQRRLDYGVLFNLREVRVFHRGRPEGYEPDLSFPVLPLWQYERGEAIPAEELPCFLAFCDRFAYHEVTLEQKVAHIAHQEDWTSRFGSGETFTIDVEALVERLRKLSEMLVQDAGAQIEALDTFLALDPDRERKLLDELALLANDIAPGTDPGNLPASVEEWRRAAGGLQSVWRQYLLRVVYLALTRILLYRAWEDVEFVESYLYDGGFERWYERRGRSARSVLREAFLHGGDRYPWLFARENNYDWYRPSESALVEVLYTLAPEPLGKLDADVLGSLYATYVEDIDRDRLGQFFTPRDVVGFMLDRVGFVAPDVFRIEGDTRQPIQILDFATGSGGFLVEAARRIIDAVGAETASARELLEALGAIVNGFTGGEISPFPYYLTEINVLLQVSRLLGPLHATEDQPPPFGALGVLPVDTLTAKTAPSRSLEIEPRLRADKAEIVEDERFGLVPLDEQKRRIYRDRLRKDESFDLVIGNPPYVSEANNKPLFDRLRAIPAWEGIYRGKTDYLYYFLWLAVEKLAPGGRLCVITPAGWMNAGAADLLREKLSSELMLEELFLFGSYRLFATADAAPTPTVESAILVATKRPAPSRHKLRVVALENEAGAPADRHELLEEMRRRANGRSGRRRGIHVHDVAQALLRPEYPWPVKFGAKDVHARVVAHLQALLDERRVEPLQASWKVTRGIETGADAFTRRIERQLKPDDRTALRARGAEIGQSILELPAKAELDRPWVNHPDVLVRAPESHAILYGAVDETEYTSLVVIRDDPPEAVLRHLEQWRPLLVSRAEIRRNPRRKWWEALWPRHENDMAAPKVIALYRTDRGRFALDEDGSWQPSNKTTIVIGRSRDAPVAYLCGVLNSELLDLWYAVRGKTPWHVRRNYEPLRMNEMPYRPPDGDSRVNEIEQLVRRVADNRRTLLPHRRVFKGLERIVKDPWRIGPLEVDEAALVAELPPDETISVRLDPALEKDVPSPSRARVIRVSSDTIELRRGRGRVGKIAGDQRRLELLETMLGGEADERVLETVLPKDTARFDALVEERRRLVEELLEEGRRLVEQVERLVCALYEVTEDLTDDVVAYAVARAVRASS